MRKSEPALGTIRFVHDLVQEFSWVRGIHAGLDDEEMKLPHVVLGPIGLAFDPEVLLESSATSHASKSEWLRLLRWIEARLPGTEDDRNGVVNLVFVSFVEEFLQPSGTAAFERACNLLPPKLRKIFVEMRGGPRGGRGVALAAHERVPASTFPRPAHACSQEAPSPPGG